MRYLGTVFLVLSVFSFIILFVGVVKNWMRLFFPYFGMTISMIIVAIFGSSYSVFRPEERKLALMEMLFVVLEARQLYSVVSYYRQVKAKHLDYQGSYDVQM